MRNYRNRRVRRAGRNDGSFWLSFSDLMSSLLLIIILILFYIMYQYFEMYEINMAEIARQQYDLDEANASLESERTRLSEAEQQMLAQQIRLNAAEDELADAQAVLAQQQEDLEAAQALLAQSEEEISQQQTQLSSLSDQLSAQQATLDSQQAQIEQLVGVRTQIISALSGALRTANISATVDPTSGAIALESDVLFATGEYSLTEEGRAWIDDFLPVYLDVLLSDEYRGYVAEIIIEGHTDSVGSYLSNLELSQQRAAAVAAYVLGDDYSVITDEQRQTLRQLVTANGRSYSDLVLDENGNEDRDASRRVVFKFRLTDEEMIAQLQQILEQGGASSEATVSFEAVDTTPEPAADATPAPDGGSDAADPAATENTGTGE